ncbi:MAG: hypothetical protein ACI4OT_03225 [Bacilli bacterium]
MDSYLIPANANRGKLIFGYFRPIDLIIFGTGFVVSFIMLLVLDLTSTLMAVLALTPVGITGMLVFPIPYYHNTLVVIQELIRFLNNRQRYIWKGWCYKNGTEDNK